MPVAWLCDFDGTIAPADIGAAFVRRHTRVPEERRRELLEQWKSDAIGSRRLTESECETLRATEDEALAFTRGFRLDEHFAPFVRETRGRGDAVMVVSDGFDFYVRDHLARAGLGDVPWAANRVRFEADGAATVEFPFEEGGCGRCGNCKAQHVRRYQALGYHTVMVGDGFSDRCGARVADAVVARGALLGWCREQSLVAWDFETFAEVADLARRFALDAAPRRR